MVNKKRIYSVLGLCSLVLVLLCMIKPHRKCTQCELPVYIQDVETGEITIYRESLLVRMFSPNCSFLHLYCLDDYFRDHPIERDEEGRIIPKT